MERHADGFDDPLPSVHCHIVHGYEDVTPLSRRVAIEGVVWQVSSTKTCFWILTKTVMRCIAIFPHFARQKCQLSKVEGCFSKKVVVFSSRAGCFFDPEKWFLYESFPGSESVMKEVALQEQPCRIFGNSCTQPPEP